MFWLDQLLSLAATLYVLLFVALAALVLWLPKRWLWKGIGLLVVSAVFATPLVQAHFKKQERLAHNRMIADRFTKLCKENAGEKIYKTVEGVEGFLIMRPRKPTTDNNEYREQYWMGDPYGHSDLEARHPEAVFLDDRRGYDSPGRKITPIAGYDFIEMPPPLPTSDAAMRYLRIDVVNRPTDIPGTNINTTRYFVAKLRSRYGYDWEDISTKEDRKYWIAGGRMRIIELETQTIMAERTGYLIDVAQGASEGSRKPWLLAQRTACPPFESESTKAKEFVTKVLKPMRESKRD